MGNNGDNGCQPSTGKSPENPENPQVDPNTIQVEPGGEKVALNSRVMYGSMDADAHSEVDK